MTPRTWNERESLDWDGGFVEYIWISETQITRLHSSQRIVEPHQSLFEFSILLSIYFASIVCSNANGQRAIHIRTFETVRLHKVLRERCSPCSKSKSLGISNITSSGAGKTHLLLFHMCSYCILRLIEEVRPLQRARRSPAAPTYLESAPDSIPASTTSQRTPKCYSFRPRTLCNVFASETLPLGWHIVESTHRFKQRSLRMPRARK